MNVQKRRQRLERVDVELQIAIIGCRQGLRVERGAEGVGRATTTAVVQAIFAVIVINAFFSILFNVLGL